MKREPMTLVCTANQVDLPAKRYPYRDGELKSLASRQDFNHQRIAELGDFHVATGVLLVRVQTLLIFFDVVRLRDFLRAYKELRPVSAGRRCGF